MAPHRNANSSDRLEVGSHFGGYVIHRCIGKGGMGEVYLAKDPTLHRHVAIKIISEELAKDQEAMHRFRLEGQALARLNHPNLVTIFEVDEDRGIPYMAMEFIEGISLASYLLHGTFGLREAIHIIRQITEGVAAAHRAGIIHRDLKPVNVIVDEDHHLKIIDFGIARFIDQSPDTHQTQFGTVLGTLSYLSPEMAKGQPATIQADIYAIGVIFFELLTGQRPFEGASHLEVLEKIKRMPLEFPNSVADLIPPSVQSLIRRMTCAEVTARFQSTAEILAELKKVQVNEWPEDLQNVWPRCDLTNENEVHQELKKLGFERNEFGLIINLAWQIQQREEVKSDRTQDLSLNQTHLTEQALQDGVDLYRRARAAPRSTLNSVRSFKSKMRSLNPGFAGAAIFVLLSLSAFFFRPSTPTPLSEDKNRAVASLSLKDPGKIVAKVYLGPENERVTVLSKGPAHDNQEIFILFQNTNSELDGKLIAHVLRVYNGKEDYQILNKDYVSMTKRADLYEAYPPDKDSAVRLRYSSEASENVGVANLLRKFGAK